MSCLHHLQHQESMLALMIAGPRQQTSSVRAAAEGTYLASIKVLIDVVFGSRMPCSRVAA